MKLDFKSQSNWNGCEREPALVEIRCTVRGVHIAEVYCGVPIPIIKLDVKCAVRVDRMHHARIRL